MKNLSIERIVRYFERIGEPDYAEFMRWDGVVGKKILGVRIKEIHRYAKELIPYLNSDNELAYNFIKSLCTSDIRELQQLGASLLKQINPKTFGEKLPDLLDEIIPYIKNWEFCDTLSSVVAYEIPFGKMVEYAGGDEWSARFGLVCSIFAIRKELDLKSALKILDVVIEKNPKPSSQLKKAIKWAKREFTAKQ